MDSPGSASPASPAPGAAPGGGLAAKPAFNELEDALPPSLRTAKLMMKVTCLRVPILRFSHLNLVAVFWV